jgi:hypothetical protein
VAGLGNRLNSELRAEVMGSLDAAERALIIELAVRMLNEIEPAEVPVLEQTAADYFTNPNGVLSQRRRDESLGFGLDLTLMGPYALAVASSVVTFVGSIIADEARDAARPIVIRTVRRLLGAGEPSREQHQDGHTSTSALTVPQVTQIRDVARSRAIALGISTAQASLLADALIGGLTNGDHK